MSPVHISSASTSTNLFFILLISCSITMISDALMRYEILILHSCRLNSPGSPLTRDFIQQAS